MQPEWRSPDVGWPLSRVIPEGDHSWSVLEHAGPNGFFLILMALSWWVQAVECKIDLDEDLLGALDDVLWVLTNIIKGTERSKKRGIDDVGCDDNGSGGSRSKRYV